MFTVGFILLFTGCVVFLADPLFGRQRRSALDTVCGYSIIAGVILMAISLAVWAWEKLP